jgi:hypothetical protein
MIIAKRTAAALNHHHEVDLLHHPAATAGMTDVNLIATAVDGAVIAAVQVTAAAEVQAEVVLPDN